jgi:hypothetical protein
MTGDILSTGGILPELINARRRPNLLANRNPSKILNKLILTPN